MSTQLFYANEKSFQFHFLAAIALGEMKRQIDIWAELTVINYFACLNKSWGF
jgi:hypothetical protein